MLKGKKNLNNLRFNLGANAKRIFNTSIRRAQKEIISTKETFNFIRQLKRENTYLRKENKCLKQENKALKRRLEEISFDGWGVSTGGKKRILILGAGMPLQQIYGCVEDVGFEKANFDIHDNYQKNKRFNLKKIQHSSGWLAVILGPVAHNVVGLGDYSSVLERMRREKGYPPVYPLRTKSGHLKATKTSLKNTLLNIKKDLYKV